MSDQHQPFVTLLFLLAPLLLPLWLWAARRALGDLLRPTATGPALARAGLPDRPLGPSPAMCLLQRRPAALPRHALPAE